MTNTRIVVGLDIAPNVRTAAVDYGSLKALTLLNDVVLFDMATKDQWIQIRGGLKKPNLHDEYLESYRPLDELFSEVRTEAPKRWKLLEPIWSPLPRKFNTTQSRIAYQAVAYGATSGLPGFSELDYFISAALNHVRYAQFGDPRFTSEEFHLGLHGAWLWCAMETGLATKLPHLFDALRLFIRSGNKIRFNGPAKSLEEIIDAVRQWTPETDKLFESQESENPTRMIELLIPNFRHLSWDEILYLRSHRQFGRFRHWIDEVQGDAPPGKQSIELKNRLIDQLWELASEVNPNVGGIAVKGILSNVPLGIIPVNPIGIVTSLREIRRARSIESKFGNVFWLFEARQMASK